MAKPRLYHASGQILQVVARMAFVPLRWYRDRLARILLAYMHAHESLEWHNPYASLKNAHEPYLQMHRARANFVLTLCQVIRTLPLFTTQKYKLFLKSSRLLTVLVLVSLTTNQDMKSWLKYCFGYLLYMPRGASAASLACPLAQLQSFYTRPHTSMP